MSSEQQMVEYKVADEKTGLYRESPAYVYGLLQDELTFGHIVQAEI
jgi:hypothetical protein